MFISFWLEYQNQAIATIDATAEGCTVSRLADGTVSASPACLVTRSYYDALGRAYAVVQHLSGQAITSPELPEPSLRTETANRTRYTLYNAQGQALASVAPDPGRTVERAAATRNSQLPAFARCIHPLFER